MLAIVSPAKKLDMNPLERSLSLSQPSLMGDIEQLAKTAKRLKPKDLQSLMGISEALASLNHERFQTFTTPFTPENAKPAALMFNGDTYSGLEASSLSEADLTWPSCPDSTGFFAHWISSSPTDSRWVRS